MRSQVFTPVGGTSFADNLTVTATTATEGAKVYYTTEAAPAECATEFPANGLTISATTTIRAIAKMEDGSLDASAEATATYTRIEALKGIKALRDRIKDDGITKQDDAKEYHVSLTDAVVTKASGKAASIEEGSTGVYYYSDNNTLKAGQRINGTVTVKGFLYGGWPEIISIGGGEITDGEAPEPAAATLAEIKSDYGKYESRYVKVAGAKVTKAFDRQNGEISQDGTDMALRAADNTIKMTVGKTVDVAGIVGIYNSTKQINVYGQSDITEKDVPVFAFTSDRATVEITDESPELPELTNTYEDKTVTYTSSDTDVADFDNGELLLLSAGTTTITAALASDESVTASYTLEVKKTKGTLAFEQDVYTVNIGETITLKATSNDTKATITYSAPKTEDGYVLDENTGDFIAGDNAMTVTVTAEAAGSDYYTAATATCTVKIVDPNAAADEYKKVNSSEEIVDGGVYLVICESEKTAMSKYGKKYMTVAENIEIANGVYVGEVNIEGKPYEMTINKSSEEGYYTLKTEEGFMKSGEKTELIVENSLEENNGAYLWTIDTDNEYSPIYNKELSERFFAYNPNGGTNPRFALYTNSTNAESRKPVYLYKKVSTTAMGVITIDGENSGYATFYSDKAYVMPEGVEGATVTAVNDEDGTLTVSYAYKAGSTVPAKTALLIKGEAGTHKVEYTESDESAPEGNMLHGADAVDAEGNTFVEGENVRYYILSHNTAGTDLGFYWAAENGAAVEYNAPYAFLAVDSKANVVMYSIEGGDGTTGITTVDGDNAKRNTGVYTISGMHIGDSTKNLPAGLYIVNGKKTVVGKTE